jgi:D-glycero-alpha-D-manno-heptose-7-phosphate kinase
VIITRSPLRVPLGGGGTDLPSYYQSYGGFLIAGAINKYVYITIHRRFVDGFLLKYSKLEECPSVDDIQHPIIRESLKMVGVTASNLEITSMADIPAGTGLGSSGSFTTALLKALHAVKKSLIHQRELAEEACTLEIDILREPIGKQDQYVAAYGGITCFDFARDGRVNATPLAISEETLFNLEDNLLLFFTGFFRSASAMLKDQHERTKGGDASMVENLHFVKELGFRTKDALELGDLTEFGRIMDCHWQRKRSRSDGMTNPMIDSWYDCAMRNGAVGGKLIGAGGGGFLMFYAEDKAKLRHAMRQEGLQEVRFGFDFEGSRIVSQD